MGLFSDKAAHVKAEWREGGKVAAQHRKIVAQEKADKRAAKSAAKGGKVK